jgi:hypothetical protein
LIGWEGVRFAEDFESFLGGPVEGVHHEMEVGRKRAHAGDFSWLRSLFTFKQQAEHEG